MKDKVSEGDVERRPGQNERLTLVELLLLVTNLLILLGRRRGHGAQVGIGLQVTQVERDARDLQLTGLEGEVLRGEKQG